LAPHGSILTVWVPVVVTTEPVRLKLALHDDVPPMLPPGGGTIDTETHPSVFPVILTVMPCPDVAAKLRRAFWPGTESVTGIVPPLIVRVPVASAGTAYDVTVVLPVLAALGSMIMEYVPVSGKSYVSTKVVDGRPGQ
jgi:hypothetical protein